MVPANIFILQFHCFSHCTMTLETMPTKPDFDLDILEIYWIYTRLKSVTWFVEFAHVLTFGTFWGCGTCFSSISLVSVI